MTKGNWIELFNLISYPAKSFQEENAATLDQEQIWNLSALKCEYLVANNLMPSPDPNIGRILEDRYELIELLGQGAMGCVYLGRHRTLGGAIAVKFLSQAVLREEMRERFLNEAKSCAQLGQESIHIVRVSDFGVDEQSGPFYVMEHLQGKSLDDLLKPGPLPLHRFFGILRQTCLGLKAAHEGIMLGDQRCPVIHRDIKPSNILVTPDASLGELTKILDFGIAKLIEGETNESEGFMGTMAYSSPEQMEGQEPTVQSDIYSLGVLMFRSLTGKLPIQAAHPNFGSWYKAQSQDPPREISEVAPQLQLPQDLITLIYRCLDKKPENRPANMAEILESLRPIEEQLGAEDSNQLTQLQSSTLQLDAVKETKKPPNIDEICLRQTWPKGKPIAQLVFPQRLKTKQGDQLTLWVMLPNSEIQQLSLGRLYTQVYRNCFCAMTPHPMMMWITALNSRFFRDGQDARWLPCFLDLKSQQGQLFARLLAAQGEYRVLFFTLEHPHRCAHVLQTKLSTKQCSQLGQWIIESQTRLALGEPSQSRQKLKNELVRLKAETTF